MPAGLHQILMIEDDVDIRDIAQLALESMGGYQVHAFASGEEALRHVPELAPDLVLLDVMMPGLDGPATLAKLRELPTCAATPVIFMTARASASERKGYLELGAIEVIKKPFDALTLATTVKEIWDRKVIDRDRSASTETPTDSTHSPP